MPLANRLHLCKIECDRTRQGYARKRTLKPAGHFFVGTMPRPFDKPSLSYTDQVNLLQQRGMIIEDTATAIFYLQHINYYRLSAYWLPFEADHVTHEFKRGTTFEAVLQLYIFDRELRLLVLDAIERIEVSIRAQWAHQMAQHHGPHAHLNKDLAADLTHWEQNIEGVKKEVERSDEIFIHHLRQTYSEPLPPIWAVCEVMSLGLLSKWYYNLRPMPTRRAIADVYSLDQKVLSSWLHHLSIVRNVCAHHSRLWDREITFAPKVPKNKPSILSGEFVNSRKIYNSLVILLYWMDVIAPHHHWRKHLKELIAKHLVSFNSMGFPSDWASRRIWQEMKA